MLLGGTGRWSRPWRVMVSPCIGQSPRNVGLNNGNAKPLRKATRRVANTSLQTSRTCSLAQATSPTGLVAWRPSGAVDQGVRRRVYPFRHGSDVRRGDCGARAGAFSRGWLAREKHTLASKFGLPKRSLGLSVFQVFADDVRNVRLKLAQHEKAGADGRSAGRFPRRQRRLVWPSP